MKCWMRVCELTIGDRVLSGPPMSIEFEEEFTTTPSGGAKIKVSNPSPETIAAAQKKYAKVIMTAGYKDDYGTVFTGEVAQWDYQKGQTSVLELRVKDASNLWSNAIVNRSWKGSVSASTVAKELLKSFGLTGRIDVASDVQYNSKSFAGCSLSTALKTIAKDTGSELYFRFGTVVMSAQKKGYQQGYYLTPESGLLNYQESPSGYKIKTLFLYQLGAGSVVKLKTDSGDVDIKALKGNRKFSIYGEAGIEFEAVRL